MAVKYYVWSPLQTADGVVPLGTEVTEKDYPNDWQQLIDGGSVRTRKFPKMPATYQGSPRSFMLDQLKKMRDDIDADIYELESEEDE